MLEVVFWILWGTQGDIYICPSDIYIAGNISIGKKEKSINKS